jgi:hypothetical protein
MIHVMLYNGTYRIVIVCDWCQELIEEDYNALYMWNIERSETNPTTMVCLHAHCASAYKSTHHIVRKEWASQSLSEFRSDLLLEHRLPVHRLRVRMTPMVEPLFLRYQPTLSDQYVTTAKRDLEERTTHVLTFDGGFITLDLDDTYSLAQIEINIPREQWRVTDRPSVNLQPPYHSLQFIDLRHTRSWSDTIAQGEVLHTDSAQTWVFIPLIDTHAHRPITHFLTIGTWVALSPTCAALIAHECLHGLFFLLDTEA